MKVWEIIRLHKSMLFDLFRRKIWDIKLYPISLKWWKAIYLQICNTHSNIYISDVKWLIEVNRD